MPGTLIITRGLPASGKTTWAKQIQASGESIIIVCRDDLREMLHSSLFSQENEKKLRDDLCDYLARTGGISHGGF